MATGEVRSPYNGKLIYRPEDRLRTGIKQAIGAPTIELTQQRAMDMIAAEAIERYRRLNTSFAKEAAMAIIKGEGGRVPSIRGEARAAGIILEERSIRYQVKQLQRDANMRRRRRIPKALRQDLDELYDATGRLEPEILP
jgi:hypothetical protein